MSMLPWAKRSASAHRPASGEVKADAFDEKIAAGGDVRQHEMTTVGGKGDLVFTGGDGARLRA
jgi:hypothetical protein